MKLRNLVARRTMLGLAVVSFISVGSSALAGDGREPAPATVRVQSASSSLPIMAAMAEGYFAAENLTVDHSLFASSRAAFQLLNTGGLEIVISSADNAVNYRVNPSNPAGGLIPAQIIFGHDLGLGLALAALPGFITPESLQGQVIGVDQPGSGFALVAAKIMRGHGMEAGIDYTMVAAGGSPARLAGLRASPPLFPAAVLNADSIVRAQADGFPVLATVSSVVEPYTGGIGAANETWLKANPGVAIRFIRAFYRGMGWVRNPANRAQAIIMLTDATTPAALAAQIYDAAVGPAGLSEGASLSRTGLLNVLKLRAEFNGFDVPQDLEFLASPASGLYDLSYYECAVEKGRREHR